MSKKNLPLETFLILRLHVLALFDSLTWSMHNVSHFCVFVTAKFMLLQIGCVDVCTWVQYVVSIQNVMYSIHFGKSNLELICEQ